MSCTEQSEVKRLNEGENLELRLECLLTLGEAARRQSSSLYYVYCISSIESLRSKVCVPQVAKFGMTVKGFYKSYFQDCL